MSTFHEDAAHNIARDWVGTRKGAMHLHGICAGLASGQWSPGYVAMIGQVHRIPNPARWPLEQVASFGQMHALITAGAVSRIALRAAGEPRSDRERAENSQMLADLPEPFWADVSLEQHHDDQDGYLHWSQPIQVQVQVKAVGPPTINGKVLDGERDIFGNVAVTVGPGRVPLEIGASHPSRTLAHVIQDRGVARWPYGTDWVWLLLSLRYFAPQPADNLPDVVLPTGGLADRGVTS